MKTIVLTFMLIFSLESFSQEMKPYKIFLKPGSELTDMNAKKAFKLEKGIYVSAFPMRQDRRQYLVFDKNLKPAYVVSALHVVEIQKDIQLLPNHDAETTYPIPSEFNAFNKHAFLDTQFNYHVDNLNITNLGVIPFGESDTNALANRLEVRTLYTSSLPVNFGFTFNYEFATWSTTTSESEEETGTVNLSILSFGPQLQRYVYEDDDMAVSLLLGAEYAPIYRLSTSDQNANFNSLLLNLGAEVLWGTRWGKWSLGSHFRRHDLTLKSTSSSDLEAVPENIVVTSIGVMLGYKYEWDL